MLDLIENFTLVKNLLEHGEVHEARSVCAHILSVYPDNAQALEVLGVVSNEIAQIRAKELFTGPGYRNWLSFFHELLEPEGYIEIGVADGGAICLAKPPTRVIGIDPAFSLVNELSTWTKLYKKESDQFFLDHDPKKILDSASLDFAFIDGLHTFDQALKDFINIEKESHRNTLIGFHDIYPVDPIVANRQRITTFWVGDTWKVIPILKKYRPDLEIFTIPTYPSGLGIVTHLNPDSTVLEDNFDEIVSTYMSELDSEIISVEKFLNVTENDFCVVQERLNSIWNK